MYKIRAEKAKAKNGNDYIKYTLSIPCGKDDVVMNCSLSEDAFNTFVAMSEEATVDKNTTVYELNIDMYESQLTILANVVEGYQTPLKKIYFKNIVVSTAPIKEKTERKDLFELKSKMSE